MKKLLDGAQVEWTELGNLCEKISSGKNKKKSDDGLYPVFGSTGVIGRTDSKVYETEQILVARVGANAGRVYIAQGEYDVSDNTLIVQNKEGVALKYLYYYLVNIGLNQFAQGAGQPLITGGQLKGLFIPIPCPDNSKKSLKIQAEIVCILDAFTAMTAELTAELRLRKKQYNYYRDQLLSFEEEEVEWKTLGDVCESISSGKNKDKSEVGEFPVYGSTGIIGRTDNKVYEIEQILVARVGANAGRVNIANGKYDVSDNTLMLKVKDNISLKYLFYYLVNLNLNRFVKGAGQPLLTAGQLKAMIVPIPSAEEQARIVAILDKFDTLTNSISEGLPREIELRQKQYEYYRDLLLSFPKPDAEVAA
ncbi:restriction endonuclease subunit S [Neptunomonas qingdaonensis]|nr:restriction endonuclease subunit S [Neptunomonas qingdaonensis]